MSIAYAEKYGTEKISKEEMRDWVKRPGKHDEDGKPLYTTEQHHKKECDINCIIKKYDKTGLINHVSKFEAKYGDFTGMEFSNMQNIVANANSAFQELPAEIRSRFKNNPKNLVEFMEHPENREEAIKLGLIDEKWTPETDGLGEHVKEGENVKKE